MFGFLKKKKVEVDVVRNRLMQLRDKTGQKFLDDRIVQDIQIVDEGVVFVSLQFAGENMQHAELVRHQVELAVQDLPGVRRANVVLTAERSQENKQGNKGAGANKKPPPPEILPHVRYVIAVASGKGGVGKSTVSANLAVALAAMGHKVGLLDADIYGPSQPRMMGIKDEKPQQEKGGKIVPPIAHGVKVMSIGFMVEEETAMIWRGPMVQSALIQLMRDVEWGTQEEPLDILVVDFPPGTGDAQLTMAQRVPFAGAVVVSTPQDIALIDARKGLEMFRKVHVPILGIIENMSMYICSNCGHEDHIFGHGGARDEAEKLGVAFLGEIPLNANIRQSGDAGEPVSNSEVFQDIADQVWGAIQVSSKAPPKIIIE